MKITKNFLNGVLFMGLATTAIAEGVGKDIYDKSCKTCHAPAISVPLKSPGWHDSKAWEQRVSAAKTAISNSAKYSTAMDYLIAQVRQGKGMMQAGGMCRNERTSDKLCTDKEYRAAILYMCEGVCQ